MTRRKYILLEWISKHTSSKSIRSAQHSKMDTENDCKVFTQFFSAMLTMPDASLCLETFFRPLVNWLLQCMYKCMIFAYECEDWLRFVACKIEATENWMVENFTFQSTINRFGTIYPECSPFHHRSRTLTLFYIKCALHPICSFSLSYRGRKAYTVHAIYSNMLPFKYASIDNAPVLHFNRQIGRQRQ